MFFLVAGGLNGLCLEVVEVPGLEWTGLVTAGAGRGDDLGGEEDFFGFFFLVFLLLLFRVHRAPQGNLDSLPLLSLIHRDHR